MFEDICNFFVTIYNDFYKVFIEYDYYKMYFNGLGATIVIALLACLIGLAIGIVVTAVRVMEKNNIFIKILDKITRLYVTVIRGTPVVLQLFIGYFVIFKFIRTQTFFNIPKTNGIPLAGLVFGINSGAYMSEILRGGINAVDKGQLEAGRSLGLSWYKTFIKIILPQALKNAIPTMFNEFITLVKETSVAGYVGIIDLMKIRTYITTQNAILYMPLLIIAVIYLILVLGLEQIQKIIEKKLARSER